MTILKWNSRGDYFPCLWSFRPTLYVDTVCNGVMHGNVCPVKRSGPGLVTEERREEEEKWHPVIRAHVMTPAPDTGARHRTDTYRGDQTQQEENMSCVCFDVWASGLFLITEVSLSLHHQVNRPDLTVWPYYPYKSWYYYYLHHQILILSWELHPVVTLYTADNVLLTQGTDTLMQCWMINIYISDRYSMSSPPSIFRLCLYLCVITRPATAADEDQIVKNGTLREQRNQVGPI